MLFLNIMRKKRTFTLLEIVVATCLLAILLSGLFTTFHHILKTHFEVKDKKQKAFQLELFQQRMKNLFSCQKKVWIENHPDLNQSALHLIYEEKLDHDLARTGSQEGIFYLQDKKLYFVSWTEEGLPRIEVLLDQVDDLTCQLFDRKKREWVSAWPKQVEDNPIMILLDIKWDMNPHLQVVFFLKDPEEQITYTTSTV
jgi:competence protein ComGC